MSIGITAPSREVQLVSRRGAEARVSQALTATGNGQRAFLDGDEDGTRTWEVWRSFPNDAKENKNKNKLAGLLCYWRQWTPMMKASLDMRPSSSMCRPHVGGAWAAMRWDNWSLTEEPLHRSEGRRCWGALSGFGRCLSSGDP